MELFYIIFAAYSIFSIKWGFAYVDGRWEALEQPSMKNVKILVSILAGFYLGWLKLILELGSWIMKIFGI